MIRYDSKAESINYSGTLDGESFEAIIRAEDRQRGYITPLYRKLEAIPGITSVCYGTSFYGVLDYTVDVTHNLPNLHVEIVTVLKDHIKACKALLETA